MFYYLHYLSGSFGGFNVFRYNTFRALMAGVTGLLICLVLGPASIRMLTRLKLGQPIRGRADGVDRLADLHGGKKGTPTMGGILLLFSVTVSTLLWANPEASLIWLVLGSMLYLGFIGFIDDYAKVKKKTADGISARQKLLAQLFLAFFVYFFLNHVQTNNGWRTLFVPFTKEPLIFNMEWGALIFFSLVIIGCSNAVNLTDGLDGLASGCSVTVATVYGLFCYLGGNEKSAKYLFLPHVIGSGELSVFCLALGGAGLGFLWFNCHPAQVFMGDTGSLALGGALAVVAICVHQELVLILAGGVFVMEAGSVLIQVAYFKATRKRFFAMAPLHHHFELKGWNESTVTIRFWILSLLFAGMALSTLKLR